MGDDRLLDTGVLVALISDRDDAHERCVAAFRAVTGEFITSEAVLTEAMHLSKRVHEGTTRCAEFILRGGSILVPMNDRRLRRCQELMADYADVPMDFADATLVALAEETGIGIVFTLDRRDFAIYRWRGRREFRIQP